jgi:branched-chain amino acid transport system ATP-binding protein
MAANAPTPTGSPMLEVKDLRVAYGAIRAIHGVSLKVFQGEIVTLIGCNGAGKTTTLRAISGLVRPAAGSIAFEGKSLTRVPAHQIVRLGIAHSPEGRGVFPNMSVSENLDLGAYARHDHDAIAADREKALGLFPGCASA